MGRLNPNRQRMVDDVVTPEFLAERIKRHANYPKAKWIEFAETMLSFGLTMTMYEAKETASKDITVTDGVREYKVRYSNHKPNQQKERFNDCDFFVGKNHGFTSNSRQAIAAVRWFFFGEVPTIPMPHRFTRPPESK